METLKLNARLRTGEHEVLLDPTLPVGRYLVSLVVTGDRGESMPATLRITVERAIVRPPVVGPVLLTPVAPARPMAVTPAAARTATRNLTPPRAPKRKPSVKKPRRKIEE